MELLERYLQAIRFFLPQRQQDDIVRELSENLTSEIEDQEATLGRPLTEAELADVLRRNGHPMLVAGRYRGRQHLIGPVFFPIYLFALKAGLLAALLVTVVIGVITWALTGQGIERVVQAMLAFPDRALMVFAWTTLGFAGLDLAQSRLKLPRSWDPRKLPKLSKPEHRLPRFSSLCELLFTVAAIIWLLLVPGAPFLALGPAAEFLALAPAWSDVYVPILLLTAATGVLSLVNFIKPSWSPARSWARLIVHAASLVLVGVVLRAGPWVVVSPGTPPLDPAHLTRLVDAINTAIQIALVFSGLFSLVEVGRQVRRLQRRRPSSQHRPATS
jgi:hypothetical protein